MFDAAFITKYYPVLLEAYGVTLGICFVSFFLAWTIAFAVALCRLSNKRPLRALGAVYVEVVRNIPLAIQVFLIFYTLPFIGIRLPAFGFGVVALSVYIAAYYAEIVRAAALSVPRGQYESARGTGMSHLQAMRRVVFPQMRGFLIPPATNVTITLLKESSVLSIITIPELTLSAMSVSGESLVYVEVFLMVALLYWATTGTLTVAARGLERAAERHKTRVAEPGGNARAVMALAAAERLR